MSLPNEIKCPHCGQWTTSNNKVDDKCQHCGGYLEPHRFSRAAEKKTRHVANPKQKDFFPIKHGDGQLMREVKGFINAMGWIVFYSEMAFYASMILVITLLGIIAG
jgi:hypothetical protein